MSEAVAPAVAEQGRPGVPATAAAPAPGAAGAAEESAAAEAVVRGFCHTCNAIVGTSVNEETCEVECASCSGTFVEVNPEDEELGLREFLGRDPARRPGGRGRRGERSAGGSSAEPSGDMVAGAIQQILTQVLGGQAQSAGEGPGRVEVLGAIQPLFATTIGAGGSLNLGDYAVGNLSNVIDGVREGLAKGLEGAGGLFVGKNEGKPKQFPVDA